MNELFIIGLFVILSCATVCLLLRECPELPSTMPDCPSAGSTERFQNVIIESNNTRLRSISRSVTKLSKELESMDAGIPDEIARLMKSLRRNTYHIALYRTKLSKE